MLFGFGLSAFFLWQFGHSLKDDNWGLAAFAFFMVLLLFPASICLFLELVK